MAVAGGSHKELTPLRITIRRGVLFVYSRNYLETQPKLPAPFLKTIFSFISTTNTTTSSIFAPNLYLIFSAAKSHGVEYLNYQKSQFSKINISTSYIDIRSIHNPISYGYYTTRFIGFNPIINSSKIVRRGETLWITSIRLAFNGLV